MKITFVGDIMCEPGVLLASIQRSGEFDFTPIFAQVKDMFHQADYVIANLETPLAGESAVYTNSYYVFNSPDSFADAIHDAGVDFLTTACNHVFDRGMPGLIRTIQILDEKGIRHTGTFIPGTPRERAAYIDIDGTKVAVISYTYSTNFKDDPADPRYVLAEGEYAGTVNLLRNQRESAYLPGVFRGDDWVDRLTKPFLPDEEARGQLKLRLGMEGNYPRSDDNLQPETMAPYMEQLMEDIIEAKKQADVVIVCPHVGGQFNSEPGAVSRYVIDICMKAGADAVMAGHSHCVQKMELRGNSPIAYSLGNFSMCPNSSLMVPESLPAYALAVHLYIEDKKIAKTTFSILKAVQNANEQLVSWPIEQLYKTLGTDAEREELHRDVLKIYQIVTGGKSPEEDIICSEFIL